MKNKQTEKQAIINILKELKINDDKSCIQAIVKIDQLLIDYSSAQLPVDEQDYQQAVANSLITSSHTDKDALKQEWETVKNIPGCVALLKRAKLFQYASLELDELVKLGVLKRKLDALLSYSLAFSSENCLYIQRLATNFSSFFSMISVLYPVEINEKTKTFIVKNLQLFVRKNQLSSKLGQVIDDAINNLNSDPNYISQLVTTNLFVNALAPDLVSDILSTSSKLYQSEQLEVEELIARVFLTYQLGNKNTEVVLPPSFRSVRERIKRKLSHSESEYRVAVASDFAQVNLPQSMKFINHSQSKQQFLLAMYHKRFSNHMAKIKSELTINTQGGANGFFVQSVQQLVTEMEKIFYQQKRLGNLSVNSLLVDFVELTANFDGKLSNKQQINEQLAFMTKYHEKIEQLKRMGFLELATRAERYLCWQQKRVFNHLWHKADHNAYYQTSVLIYNNRYQFLNTVSSIFNDKTNIFQERQCLLEILLKTNEYFCAANLSQRANQVSPQVKQELLKKKSKELEDSVDKITHIAHPQKTWLLKKQLKCLLKSIQILKPIYFIVKSLGLFPVTEKLKQVKLKREVVKGLKKSANTLLGL